MIRILIYLVCIVLAAAGITGLTNLSGRTAIRVGDTLFDVHSGLFLGLIAFALIVTIVTTLIGSGLWRLPKQLARQRDEGRRTKGMIALTRGLEAVAAGDAADAQRHARLAMKQLNEPGVTRLLTAQAAQLAGDEKTAQESFSAMLEAPETEFLGLRGLYLQSMTTGDRKEAREYAERAFKLRPGAEWAYNSVFNLNIERGSWGDAYEALLLARQHGLEPGEASRRREAVLLTAQAYGAEAAEDNDVALKEAETALKKVPGFAPAAVLAARLEGKAGRRSKGARILDDAWAVTPHPAIAKSMSDLYADESDERRIARLRRLADRAPGADESLLLHAEQDIAEEDYEAARQKLEPLLTKAPRARAFATMAAAMKGEHGADAAQFWLDRAAAAPLDPVPGADGVFHFTRDGWISLIREFGEFGRLAPPPIEEIQTGLSHAEIKLLTAPPPPLEVVEEEPDFPAISDVQDADSVTEGAALPETDSPPDQDDITQDNGAKGSVAQDSGDTDDTGEADTKEKASQAT